MRVPSSFSICLVLCAYFVVPFFLCFPQATTALDRRGGGSDAGPVPVSDGPTVRRNERWTLESSEFGEISAVKISDGRNGCYHLHFITMNPCSLFLPAYLHSEMVFYVNSGRGTLSWMNVEEDNDDKLQRVTLQRGDIYRLSFQTVFYLQNNAESYDYQLPLEIYAIFPGSETQLHTEQQLTGAYIGIHDLLLGFNNNVLQSTLSVSESVIEQLRGGEGQPMIVEAGQPVEASTSMWDDVGSWNIRALIGTKNSEMIKQQLENKKKKKKEAYNIFNKDRDIVTCNGWSVTVTKKELDVLKNTDFGVFMVNLNTASMMGPHWNPNTAEVAIVLQGQGMIEVVCPSIASETGCKNLRFRVEEGDVFVVPRYHPMAQISFNNESFVFTGFMLKLKKESPQSLTGKLSILQNLDRLVLAKSFNVDNMTIDQVLRGIQKEKVFYECVSCAEEEVERESEEGSGAGRQEEERGGGRRGRQQKEEGRGGRRQEGGGSGGRQPEEEGGKRREEQGWKRKRKRCRERLRRWWLAGAALELHRRKLGRSGDIESVCLLVESKEGEYR